MLSKEQMLDLCKNEELIKKVQGTKSKEEALEVLAEYGLKYDSIEDFQKDASNVELSEEELEQIAGGRSRDYGGCFIIGIGGGDDCLIVGVALCAAVGFRYA